MKKSIAKHLVVSQQLDTVALKQIIQGESYRGLSILGELNLFLNRAIQGSIQYKIGKKNLVNNLELIREYMAIAEEIADN